MFAVTGAALPWLSCDWIWTVNGVPAAGVTPELTEVIASFTAAPGLMLNPLLTDVVNAGLLDAVSV